MSARAALVLALLVGACATEESGAPALSEVAQEIAVCAGPTTTYGIDVSRFQGDIDWDAVAASGVKFAFIQISRSLTDIDAKFEYNWRRAKEVGILRGAYQRFHPGQDVLGQANLFLSKLGPYEAGDLPPVLDFEDADGLAAATVAARGRQWLEHVEQELGVKPIVYTGYYFFKDEAGDPDFGDYLLWIANYGAACPLISPHWSKWTFHQYSSTANVPGVTSNTCDVNKFNGTYAELLALAKPAVCGDSVCNGPEDSDACPSDCQPCQVIDSSSEAASIVDDSSKCFVAGGDQMYIRKETVGYGDTLKWTNATDAAMASNYGRWNLNFADAGRYKVEAYTPAPFGMSKLAVYSVHHAGGMTTDAMVDQSAVDGWQTLGEFQFEAGGHGQFIRVDDNTGEANSTSTKIVFDALRFTWLDKPDPDPDPDPPSDDGCTVGGGQAGGLVLFALVGLLAPRKRRRR